MLLNPYTQVKFLKSAAQVKQLPDDTGYEVAFAGRSNAGKSSALNCLTGIHRLARTSKTPGRTQLINLFSLPDNQRRLVDLPGYGYAKVGLSIKKSWQDNLAHYLDVRKSLQGLVLLMDIRHPLKELDQTMINWALCRQLPVHVLLTKSDKLSKGQVKNTVLQVKKRYADSEELITIQAFSSLRKQGVDELILVINRWLGIHD
ncbi:MAG: ribosome biogenesis GTP-binding protein YihA/YsxC [Legionella sp.]